MQTNQSPKVEVSKDFSVPPERLYEAWTQQDQLKQWWKPMNNTLTEVKNDMVEGGSVTYVFQDNSLTISGKYAEVKENERLVYSWNWEFPAEAAKNGNYQLTVEFSPKDSGSTIKVTQDNFESEEGTYPHREGWEKGLNDLQQFLSGEAKQSPSNSSSSDDSEVAGYNEDPEQVKVGGG